jgi:hypothetical protein
VGTAARWLTIDAKKNCPREIDAEALRLATRGQMERGVLRLAYADSEQLDAWGALDAERAASDWGTMSWLTVRSAGGEPELSAHDAHRRHTAPLRVSLEHAADLAIGVERSLISEPGATLTSAPTRVPLVVEAGGETTDFAVVNAGGIVESSHTYPATLYVLPGRLRLSPNPDAVQESSVDVDVPDTGATVRLRPAALGRRSVGKVLIGAGGATSLVTLVLMAAIQGLGHSALSFRGDTPGSAGSGSFLLPALVVGACLLGVGIPLVATTDAGAEVSTSTSVRGLAR